MKLKQFRKEFSGAPYGASIFAEVLLDQLNEVSPRVKSTADTIATDNLRRAAEQYLAAELAFTSLLTAYGIDLG